MSTVPSTEKLPLLDSTKPQYNTCDYLPKNQQTPEFMELYDRAVEALAIGIEPQLISQGSSGSYFLFDINKDIVGVFKPKNEEPYGKLNPKWLKWLHRICLPFSFGRSCIIPNKGYLSEAGAYIVDRMLGLDVVPPTFITYLVSRNFNYSKLDRSKDKENTFLEENFHPICQKLKVGLPPKLGSFQKYVSGFTNCYSALYKIKKSPLPKEAEESLQFLFEKMVVLDYIIRNTDRSDNWLIRVEYPTSPVNQPLDTTDIIPNVKIAAIDNGLAFPYKHPDGWRSYPFHWTKLPFANVPLSSRIKDLVYDKINNLSFVQELEKELYYLFQIDKNFDERCFEDQMSVMKGQIMNLGCALKHGMTPKQLTSMCPAYVTLHPKKRDGLPKTIRRRVHSQLPFFTKW